MLVTGGITLLLSAIGLYAVSAFAVGQRSKEVAVRMAIGAAAERVAGSFLLDGVRLGLIGLAWGMPLSLLGLRFLAPMMDDELEVGVLSIPEVATVVAVLVLLTAAAAALVPARRAAGVDPARALRGS